MHTSDAKPYDESTLEQKYNELGLSDDDFEELSDLIDGCAAFYRIIELDQAWKAINFAAPGRFTREQFEDLVSIEAGDEDCSYSVYTEDFFYNDGKKDLYLIIDNALLFPADEDYTEEDEKALKQFLESGKNINDYDGPLPAEINQSAFFTLYDNKAIHDEYYYPKDLAKYASFGYYEVTPQTKEMKRFLMRSLGHKDMEAEALVYLFYMFIRDPELGPSEAMQKAIDLMQKDGAFKESHFNTFAGLFFTMSNATRMPCNNGFTPNELSKKVIRPHGIPAISFGPNLRQQMARGELDMSSLLSSDHLPPEMKAIVRQAAEDAEAKLPTDQKVGRSAPCPCGSGKKYKNCCGK